MEFISTLEKEINKYLKQDFSGWNKLGFTFNFGERYLVTFATWFPNEPLDWKIETRINHNFHEIISRRSDPCLTMRQWTRLEKTSSRAPDRSPPLVDSWIQSRFEKFHQTPPPPKRCVSFRNKKISLKFKVFIHWRFELSVGSRTNNYEFILINQLFIISINVLIRVDIQKLLDIVDCEFLPSPLFSLLDDVAVDGRLDGPLRDESVHERFFRLSNAMDSSNGLHFVISFEYRLDQEDVSSFSQIQSLAA